MSGPLYLPEGLFLAEEIDLDLLNQRRPASSKCHQ
ncbi:hypothetical protein PMIT1303_01659 [Prochlorococcus sp. MIT 1303]|nr:hypothetical protein PMIT1303_01659 [Prochlorococcus sp. MIT 1303]